MPRAISTFCLGPRQGSLAAGALLVIGILWLAAYGSSQNSESHAGASRPLLPRNVIVPLEVVHRFFPDINHETATGHDSTALGSPKATRTVIYATANGSKKVTITVDEYENRSGASSAFREAVQKSKAVPGFKPASVSNVGEQAFAGTVTQGAETHVGLGAIRSDVIVGLTLAGYADTPENLSKLVSLAREEEATARDMRAGGRR